MRKPGNRTAESAGNTLRRETKSGCPPAGPTPNTIVTYLTGVSTPSLDYTGAPTPTALPSSECPGGPLALRTGRSHPESAATLGIVTGYASPSAGAPVRKGERAAAAYDLLDTAARLLPEERVADCSRHPVPGTDHMEIRLNPTTGRASYGGLAVCGDLWRCPVCSRRELQRRRVVLGAAAKRARAAGLSVVLVTLTLRHHAGDPLADLVEVLNGAWTATKSGKAWRSARERSMARACARSRRG